MTVELAQGPVELAQRLDVSQSNHLLLEIAGVRTMSDMFFRMTTDGALEDFLAEEIYPYCGHWVNDPVTGEEVRGWFMRWRLPDNRTLAEWRRSSEAAALRKLWEISKTTSKKDLASVTEERVEGQASVLPARSEP